MKKLNNILLIVAFVAIIFMVPILTKLEPPHAVSSFENRTLAPAPVYSTQSLVEGKYFSSWETYFSDHVFKRDAWLKAYIFYEMKLLDRSVINSVIITPDLLLPYFNPQAVSDDLAAKSSEMGDKLEKLNAQISAYGGSFLYLAVPEQYSLFRDKYPNGYYNGADILSARESAFLSALDTRGIEYLNMRPLFEQTEDFAKFYMKTDHHYSLQGANFTYTALIEKLDSMGFDLPSPSPMSFSPLDNPFYGSRGRKLYNLAPINDKLLVPESLSTLAFSRTDNGKAVDAQVFNLPPDEISPVAYDLYMGGDKAETIINTNRHNLPRALIFGDSFTNALETMLYTSFDETRSLDLRHYNQKKLSEYIAEYKPDIVICMRDDTSFLNPEGNGNIQ